ncbi:MAG: DUF1571 domain-containing protein [Phycisphaerae bacterium]|nr:DUF1571 domain-containing protein [Phycisphaerae bacterium]
MRRTSNQTLAIIGSALSLSLATLAGCQQPEVKTPTTQATGQVKPETDRIADRIRSDPVAYLESCLDRCIKIDEFACTFYRQERLGLVPVLNPLERIFAKWRRSPLSIKFDLPDETSQYAQSLYMESVDKDKLQVLPRHGLLGLPPTVGTFPVQWSITFQKAKNRITDFGPQRMLERTLKKIAYTRENNIPGQIIVYKGIAKLEVTGQVVHHIQITNPSHRDYPHGKQDLYIDVKLQIPAGAYLWNQQGELDSMYLYADMNTAPNFTEEDFKIIPPRKAPAREQAASQPATRKAG